jgi:heme exporter protein C
MSPQRIRWTAGVAGLLGIVTVLVLHWQVFFWVPTESTMGVVQRIFYIHVPAAWVSFLAFGIVALCGAMYLWLGDDRLDMAAEAAAEGGLVFATIVLTTGPLWGKVAWGTYWTWEPRLTLTLLLWFVYLGYFLVRRSTSNPEQGKKFAAVVGIAGALDIPLIHISVSWLRSLHPQPVVLKPEGPSLDSAMLVTLMTGLLGFTLLFVGLFLARYMVSRLEHASEMRRAASVPVG